MADNVIKALRSNDPDINHFDDINHHCKYVDIGEMGKNNFKEHLSVICFNVRSYFKNSDEFLSILSTNNLDFDVIILTETRIKSNNMQLCHIPGYIVYHCYRPSKEGGGVSVFVRQCFQTEDLNLNISSDVIECIGLRVKCSGLSEWTNIVGIYRPPSGSVESFNKTLEDILVRYKCDKSSTIIAGDFNVCLLKESNNKNSLDLIDMMRCYYMYPLIDKPTRVTDTSASLIDHIWTNIPFGTSSGVLISDITDHYPVFTEFFNHKCHESSLIKIKFRDYSSMNIEYFRKIVTEVDWHRVLGDSNNPEIMVEKFNSEINKLFNCAFPIKTKNISKKRINSPWLSKALLNSIRLKHLNYKFVKRGILDISSYKLNCKILKKAIRASKKLHFKRIFEKYKTDSRKTWGTINKVINPNKTTNRDISLSDESDCEIARENIPESFNTYFSSVGSRLRENFVNVNFDFKEFLPNSVSKSFFMTPSNASEISGVIAKLKNKKGYIDSPGISVFKYAGTALSTPIELIFNLIVKTGIYPSSLKIACVTPIFKSGEKNNVKNYRPISCLPPLNVIIEKLFYSRFISFIDKNKILSPAQFGFRSSCSTSDTLIRLLHEAYKAINSDKYFSVVSLDLSKAFDTVDHNVLLYKLYHYGFRGQVYNLLESYLSERFQFVRANGFMSTKRPINIGVPQGSVLGPLLFLLYVNDMPLSISENSILMYADDTTVFSGDSNIYDLCIKLSNFLVSIDTWLKSNFLTLNISKSKYIILSYKYIPDDISVAISGNSIERSSSLNFLGVVLDTKLTFRDHVKLVRNKLSKSSGIIYKLNFLPKNILINLYYCLIYPYITYCIEVWGAACRTVLQPLRICQNKAIRSVNSSGYRASSGPIFKELQLLKIKDVFTRAVGIYMYKIMYNQKAQFILNDINEQQISHPHSLRNAGELRLPDVSILRFKQSTFYQTIKVWNALPTDLKNTSLIVFKRKLKEYLLNLY